MLRYRLKTPPGSPFARAALETTVSLPVTTMDTPAQLQFAGPGRLVAEVRAALALAGGYRGRALSLDRMIALDLAAAMADPALRDFAPTLVLGEDVLTRPTPPAATPDELIARAGLTFASWLVVGRRDRATYRSYAWESMLAQVSGIGFEWDYWRLGRGFDEAVEAIAAALATSLPAELTRLAEVYAEQPVASRWVGPTPDSAKLRALATLFVRTFDDGARTYEEAKALIPRLFAELDAQRS